MSAINKQLVLLDLDGTIIDEQYQTNCDALQEAINRLEKNNWSVGLNSDTPLPALENWAKEFNVHGPIIAERGAIVKHDDLVYDLDPASLILFKQAKQWLVSHLMELGYPIFIGDTVEMIRHKRGMGPVTGTVALVNGLKTHGLTFFIRNLDTNGNFNLSNDALETILENLVSFLRKKSQKLNPEEFFLSLDYNPDYSIFVASNQKVNKRLGLAKLISIMQPSTVVMIGNSMSDFLGNDLALHYSVANGTMDYKNECCYISKATYTQGVVEILNSLD